MVKKILDRATGLSRDESGELIYGEARHDHEKLINRPKGEKRKSQAKKRSPFRTQLARYLPCHQQRREGPVSGPNQPEGVSHGSIIFGRDINKRKNIL